MSAFLKHFIETSQKYSSQKCLCYKSPQGEQTLSYAEMFDSALKVAEWLRANKFCRSQRVALALDNSPAWSIVYFGILLAGKTAVPLDTQLPQKDISLLLKTSVASVLFVEARLKDECCRLIPEGLSLIVVNGTGPQGHKEVCLEQILGSHTPNGWEAWPLPANQESASLIFTSGTTSVPKGVQLTHQNLWINFNSIRKLDIVGSEDCFISILPLFHAYAFMATLVVPLLEGAEIVYISSLKSSDLLEAMRDKKVSVLVAVPALINNIARSISEKFKSKPFAVRIVLKFLIKILFFLRYSFGINFARVVFNSIHQKFGGNLRFIVSGGARLDPDAARAFYGYGFNILEGYGLTETSPIVALSPLGKPRFGWVGKAVDGVSVRIANPDLEGIGEVAVKGENVMKGYFDQPSLTEEVIKQNWFYTGDLGRMENGWLKITGRSKEIIVLESGKNIYPEEVEHCYRQSKFIKEAAILLPKKDPLKLWAIIVPDLESFKSSGAVNVEERVRFDVENISQSLPSYQRICGFILSKDELPKTRLGKIKRYLLSDIFEQYFEESRENPKEQEESEFLKNPIADKIKSLLANELGRKKAIKISDHLELDLGIDSLSRVEIISAIEKLFKIKVKDEDVARLAVVRDLVELIINYVELRPQNNLAQEAYGISWEKLLKSDFDSQERFDVDLQQGVMNRFLSRALKGVFQGIFYVGFSLQVSGREHIPEKGPYIICCNHASYLDAFAVICALPYKVALQMYCIGTKEIFHHPAIRWSNRMARLIAIDSASELIRAMRLASFVLRNHKILCIFPEGQRSIHGEIIQFKKGVGILAKELNLPVLPVAIQGTFQAWPRAVKYPKPYPIKLAFGRVISPQEIKNVNNGGQGQYQQIADLLRLKVVDLKRQINNVKL